MATDSQDTDANMSADTQTAEPKPFIVRFYGEERACDIESRTLDDMLAFSDQELEYHHDFIQVLFPLPERSRVNYDAPIINKETREAFLDNEHLRNSLFDAFTRMAHFYAFDVEGNENDLILSPRADFKKKARKTWLCPVDHNHLRITRIIRSLRVLGLESVAQTFYQTLHDNAQGVSSRSMMYWKRAAKRPLHLPPEEDDDSHRVISWLKDEEE